MANPTINYDIFKGAHRNTAWLIKDFIKQKLEHRRRGHLLITGTSGVGKSFLLENLLRQLDIPYFVHKSISFFVSEMGATERALADCLRLGGQHSMGLVVLEGVDLLAGPGNLNEPTTSIYLRLASVLKYCLDQTAESNIIIIGVTEKADKLHPDFCRAGRFSHFINVTITTVEQRKTILQEILPPNILTESEIEIIAQTANGFIPADLGFILEEALTLADGLKSPSSLNLAHLLRATQSIRPFIAMGLPILKMPDITTTSHNYYATPIMVGVEEQKHLILDTIQAIVNAPSQPQRRNPPRGILIYGPTGSGKTRLARECARESGLTCIHVNSTSIRSKYVGQSEKNLVDYFRRARSCAPCILFFDQVDTIFVRRDSTGDTSSAPESQGTTNRLVTCLLTELDGLYSSKGGDGIIVLAATDRPHLLDSAIIRSGRIGVHIRMPNFTANNRRAFLQQTQVPLQWAKDIELEQVVKATEGWSAAEMEQLVQEAALTVIRQRKANCNDDTAIVKLSDIWNIIQRAIDNKSR